MEPLELAFTVACPPAHAFAVWARADLAVVAEGPFRLGRAGADA